MLWNEFQSPYGGPMTRFGNLLGRTAQRDRVANPIFGTGGSVPPDHGRKAEAISSPRRLRRAR
jgi:hypothetical protein